jgi:hypothetical protein
VAFVRQISQTLADVWLGGRYTNKRLDVGMPSRLGDDHPAVTVADQHTRTGLVGNAARCSHVCRETRLRLLDDVHRVTMIQENVRHRHPSGAIGEGAVDQNDSLDLRVRRGGRRKSDAREESRKQAFHGAAPLMLATVAMDDYASAVGAIVHAGLEIHTFVWFARLLQQGFALDEVVMPTD